MRYKAKTKDCHLIVKAKASWGEEIDEKALDAFARIYLRGFLKPKVIKKNVIEYSGPVGISLYERLKKPVSKRDFLFIMEQIVVAVQKIQSNNLALNKVVLDIRYVFINDVTKEIQFLYVPSSKDVDNPGAVPFIESIVYSVILFVGNQYVIAHVGDTRVYQIGSSLNQLTTDQTFVAREISRGTMTAEQAKTDKRRNLLLQCIGASKTVEPQVICGTVEKGAYMLCSDGFRHEITEAEIYESLNPINFMNKNAMHSNARYLIEQVKSRNEKDNISVVLIKAE